MLDTIPPALRDRMEMIQLPGYTQLEKLRIAQRFLMPKQLENHGLTAEQLDITEPAMVRLIQAFTHEAGVRNLEREIANLARKVARRVASDDKTRVTVLPEQLEDFLGPARFDYGELDAEDQIGMATGLVVSDAGGDIVQVEATRMDGKDDFILTGQLGDVMKESARAGLSYVRARTKELGIDPTVFEKQTMHIHVPAGATPKDGPSAGVTMATALASLLTGRAGAARPGHDRRDHAAWAGAAHRRAEEQAAGGPPGRREDGPHSQAEREGPGRRAGGGPQRAADRAGGDHGPGPGRSADRPCPSGQPHQGGARRAPEARGVATPAKAGGRVAHRGDSRAEG